MLHVPVIQFTKSTKRQSIYHTCTCTDVHAPTCCCSVKISRHSSNTLYNLPVKNVNTRTFLSRDITANNLPSGENVKLRGVVLCCNHVQKHMKIILL